MEDKTFELMTKMYSEMQEGFKEVRMDIKDIKQDVKNIKQNMVRLENKMDGNHKALYDGYMQNGKAINKLQLEVEKLTDRVEHQEIKLQVVKGF